MEVKVKTDVTSEPLTAAVAKNYIKYSGADATEIALIATMTKAARETCEKHCGLSFAEKTLTLYIAWDDFDNNRITLPYGPVKKTGLTVKRVDQQGTETSLTLNTDYYLRGTNRVELEICSFYSTVGITEGLCDYIVEYGCGYGISTYTETLPSTLMIAMGKTLAEWYENRENWMPSLSSSVKEMLSPFVQNMWL